ncbi:von Willebrand factor type A domain containing protein [Aphelenchoides avenae]|nr:von Willebrand factor type A domain containing protein [Aphelenchus avenae]
MSDTGCYLCEINTEPMSTLLPVFLNVVKETQPTEEEKASTHHKRSSQLVATMEGDSLLLNCTVELNEHEGASIDITWTHDQNPIDLFNDKKYQTNYKMSRNAIVYTLRIADVSSQDDGLYACEGEELPRSAQMVHVNSRIAVDSDLSNDLAKVCRPVDRPLDILFLLDGSGSTTGGTFGTQVQMLRKIVDAVELGPNDTQIAVLQYASYTYLEFPFMSYRTREVMHDGIDKVRQKLGTTRTGKALDKALKLFTDPSSGVRKSPHVAQVAIVVSDGHSHDNPVPAATRLRAAGVKVMVLGIGSHINMDELAQISGDEQFAFNNLTQTDTIDQFMSTFKKFSVGERCEYSRGQNGAEIKCNADSIEVNVSLEKPLKGHMYVTGHFHDQKCVVRSNTTEVSLNLGLGDCGISRQFSVNPKGFFFEADVVLQFHPVFSTPTDKTFKAYCFYHDRSDPSEIDWQLINEHTQRKM